VNNELSHLAERLRDNLSEIDTVLQRIVEGWKRFLSSSDDYYLDGVALNLHGLYSGLERTFELVAEVIDGDKPGGENWHWALLKQMSNEIPQVRPAGVPEPGGRGPRTLGGVAAVLTPRIGQADRAGCFG